MNLDIVIFIFTLSDNHCVILTTDKLYYAMDEQLAWSALIVSAVQLGNHTEYYICFS